MDALVVSLVVLVGLFIQRSISQQQTTLKMPTKRVMARITWNHQTNCFEKMFSINEDGEYSVRNIFRETKTLYRD